jgi:uncharacterized membrane protein HdeD (DUF308 family)
MTEPLPLDDVAPPTGLWWVVLIAGVITAFVGLILIFNPFDSIAALAWLLGLVLIISGIASLFSASRRQYGIGIAVFSILVGLVLLLWPDVTIQVVAIVAGIGFIVRGILRILIGASDRRGSWTVLVFIGLVGIAFGIAVVVWPDVTIAVVGVLMGVAALVTGIGEIVAALEIRSVTA